MTREKVLFWSLLCGVGGVMWGSFLAMPLPMVLVGSAWSVAFLVSFPQKETVTLALCFSVFLGMAWYTMTERIYGETLLEYTTLISGTVRVLSDPEERDQSKQAVVRFEQCTQGTCPTWDILWQAPRTLSLAAGDRFLLSCQLTRPHNISQDFDYSMYLAKDGIGYLCQHATLVRPLAQDREGRIRAFLFFPKHVFESVFTQFLPEPEAGLGKGLLLGGSHYLSDALSQDFTRLGLTHMIAVSGYNITMIAELLLVGGLWCGLWRKQAIWSALVGIVFFIIMIGTPASAARAGCMAGIVFIALQLGRLARPLSTLLFAAFCMLLINPLLLRYDLGFQLSFLATLGIILSAPYVERLSITSLFARMAAEVLLMTVAVELLVLPIILFSFHRFSPLIIVGNFLVLLVPLTMAALFLGTLVSFVVPSGAFLLLWLGFVLLFIMTRSVEWLGGLSWASVTVSHFGVPQLLLWYSAVVIGLVFLRRYFPLYPYVAKV